MGLLATKNSRSTSPGRRIAMVESVRPGNNSVFSSNAIFTTQLQASPSPVLYPAELRRGENPNPPYHPPKNPRGCHPQQPQDQQHRLSNLEGVIDLHFHQLSLFTVVVPPGPFIAFHRSLRPGGFDLDVLIRSLPVHNLMKPSGQRTWFLGIAVRAPE